MAAEFLLTFTAEGLLTKVSSLAAQELSLAWGFKAELKKLEQYLSIIQALLQGAADQKPQDQGKAIKDWVKKLKHIAEDTDDVLDDFNYELLRRKVELQKHMKRKVLNFLSASNPLLFRLKMAHKIKKINDSLVELEKKAALINLVPKRRDSTPGGDRPDREQTDSILEPNEKVIGREDVVANIVETLISSNNQQNNLSVMAIVGMAGLGKTTLAKSVYNEPAIDAYFHKKIWVCVSNTFDVDVILSQMLESLRKKNAGMKNRDALLKSLQEELTGKKYVLVLDDVWSYDRSKWESLVSCLSKLNSVEGNKIIITTRSEGVASIAETTLSSLPRLKLRNLSDDECWSILKQRALNDVTDSIDANRERIGRAIAEKCGGIPLVAKVLGSMMRSKTTSEWLAIQNSDIWKLPQEERIVKVLKLSFDNLKSPHLKQCFAYCSQLKKDFEIERDNLVQLWMAQGLLRPSIDKVHHDIEETGNEYFNDLLENSLFQEVTDGGTKYTMHDLVHDLAEEVSKSESWTPDLNDTREVRHVARITSSALEKMPEETVGRLHSLFSDDQVPGIIFSKFRALRVLNLYGADIQELSDSFGKLTHLRYLDVSNTRIKAIPKSIGKLYNLQTLRMMNTKHLKEVPREMQNLINLRHFYFVKNVKFPAGIFKGLTNLRTLLPCYKVGKETGHGIEELGGSNQLKGELTIHNLENVRDENQAKNAKLEEKKNLLELSLKWKKSREDVSEGCSNVNDENVLASLQPNATLESLRIENYMGDKFPSWMMRNPLPLNNLKELFLNGCFKCDGLPILGHLPKLRLVEITGMHNLKRLGSDFYGYDHVHEAALITRGMETMFLFPALKTLIIRDCRELAEWMEAPTTMMRKVVVFPCLEKLSITSCPLLRNAPSHFPSLKELLIQGVHISEPMESICNEVSTLTALKIEGIEGLTSLCSGMLKKNNDLRSMEISSCKEMICIAPNVFDCCANLRVLSIWNCEKLEHLPEGLDTLPLLDKLAIRRCPALESIPIDHVMASLRELEIDDCERLSSIGLLDHCTSLQVLNIEKCRSLTSIPISHGIPSLRQLQISNCDGLSSLQSGIEHCTSLQVLKIEWCRNLTSIPISQGIPSLHELKIWNCDELSSLTSGIEHCTSLQVLEIIDCLSLATISVTRVLTSLRQLILWNCENVSCMPVLEYCSSLQILDVGSCPKLASISFSMDCLQELSLVYCDGLQSLPDFRKFTSLRELTISKCGGIKNLVCGFHIPVFLEKLSISNLHNLDSIPNLEEFTSLRELALCRIEKLKSLPTGLRCLARLERLVLGPFWEELDSFPDFQVPSQQLHSLVLKGWPKVSSLPQQVQHFTSLTSLDITSFNRVEALPDWLGNLASLMTLCIDNCVNLKYLPSLEAMERLTKLEGLYIYGCPLLKERCTEDSGEEWPKISHIFCWVD